MTKYMIIRSAVFLSVFILIEFIDVKFSVFKKNITRVLYFAGLMIFYSLSYFIPLENLFISFDTTQEVFDYYQKGVVIDELCQKESCLVWIKKPNEEYQKYILEKINTKYKIPNYLLVKKVSSEFLKDGSYEILEFTKSKEKYLVGVLFLNSDKIRLKSQLNTDLDYFVSKDTKIRFVINFYDIIENSIEELELEIIY